MKGAHIPSRAVDVQGHVFLVLRVQVEHCGHQLIPKLLIHCLAQKYDPLPVLHAHESESVSSKS